MHVDTSGGIQAIVLLLFYSAEDNQTKPKKVALTSDGLGDLLKANIDHALGLAKVVTENPTSRYALNSHVSWRVKPLHYLEKNAQLIYYYLEKITRVQEQLLFVDI